MNDAGGNRPKLESTRMLADRIVLFVALGASTALAIQCGGALVPDESAPDASGPERDGASAVTGSGSDANTGRADGSTSSDASTGREGGPGSADAGASDAALSDEACAATSSKDSCSTCCAGVHPQGVASASTILRTCACAPGRCGAACAQSLCAGQVIADYFAQDPCTSCVTGMLNESLGDAGCFDEFEIGCSSDQPCSAFFSCLTGSNCGQK